MPVEATGLFLVFCKIIFFALSMFLLRILEEILWIKFQPGHLLSKLDPGEMCCSPHPSRPSVSIIFIKNGLKL